MRIFGAGIPHRVGRDNGNLETLAESEQPAIDELVDGAAMEGGEEAPPLAGGAFLSNWNGLTVGDLFERMRTTMPQGKPGRLSRQDNADILAHMLNVNQFPTGKTELERQTEILKQIKFEANKPAKPEPQ